MAHIIIDMDHCLDAMRGNATNGYLTDLRTAYHALDDLLQHQEVEGAHELLEVIQNWLCTGGTFGLGAADQAKQYTEDCNKLL